MSSGRYRSCRLPTALADRIHSTPRVLNPKMLARKFSSDGSSRCPSPCRARKATRRPSRSPTTTGAEGSPNGVDTSTVSRFVSASMSYRPLPPMTPIRTADSRSATVLPSMTGAARRDAPDAGRASRPAAVSGPDLP